MFDLKKPLEDYQIEGAQFMLDNPRCFNLDDTGLGKTIQTIAAMSEIKDLRALVFIPGNIPLQWVQEIEKFTDLSKVILDGDKFKRASQFEAFNEGLINILIINYQKIPVDKDLILKSNPNVLVFDEATHLKNEKTISYQVALELSKKATYIWELTAMPYSKSISDIFYLFQLLNSEDFEFVQDEFTMGVSLVNKKHYNTPVSAYNYEEFIEMVKPYFIRRTYEDVKGDIKVLDFNLSELQPETFVIPKSDEQIAALQDLSLNINTGLSSTQYYFSKLKIASSPWLYSPKYSKEIPKWNKFKELLDTLEGKVIVFVRKLDFLDMLIERCKEEHITYTTITGRESIYKKEENKQKFIEEDIRVLFITTASMRGGNLQVASSIIFLDIPYTPENVIQILGRVRRPGQKLDTNVYFLVAEDTPEEDIMHTLKERQKVSDDIFDTSIAKMF